MTDEEPSGDHVIVCGLRGVGVRVVGPYEELPRRGEITRALGA